MFYLMIDAFLSYTILIVYLQFKDWLIISVFVQELGRLATAKTNLSVKYQQSFRGLVIDL